MRGCADPADDQLADSFGQLPSSSGPQSLQPQQGPPPGAAPLQQENPALAAADRSLELGLDQPSAAGAAAKGAAAPLDGLEDDDDDWPEGDELADADLEGDTDLDDESDEKA